jgi:hypothetical protein
MLLTPSPSQANNVSVTALKANFMHDSEESNQKELEL